MSEELDKRFQLELLITDREGMVAENLQRAFLNQSMAYVEDSFQVLADKILRLWNPSCKDEKKIHCGFFKIPHAWIRRTR